MSKNSVVKKFDALVSKYGFDHRDMVDMYEIDEEMNTIESALFLSSEPNLERAARRDFESKSGDLTEYGVVVVKCVYLMNWCLECFDGEAMVLACQDLDPDLLLRKCSLAYEVYWQFNSDFLLRSAMNKALELSLMRNQFFRNAHTFQHPDLGNAHYQPMLKVVSEITMLLFQHAGHLPKKNKPGLKPWLLAAKTKSHGWQLPSQGRSLVLKNNEEVQVIQGPTFSIVLCYDQASLVLGEVVEIKGGEITVIHQGKIIYCGDHSFAIDLDRNNAYTAVVDRWHAGGSRWVSEVLMQETKAPSITAHFEEIEDLMLEACGNLLDVTQNYASKIHEHLYSQELACFHFDSHLFRRLRQEFLTKKLCEDAVFENYGCLEFLPEQARNDLDIGWAALRGSYFVGAQNEVWVHLFTYTEMSLEDLAKAYIQEGGSECFASLPRRLKTEEVLRYTVETYPSCINYTTNTGVFANWGALEMFLERQKPGLAKLVQTIMATSNFSPRQAYESALATHAITVTSEQLPTFDFSDFGIPA